MTLISSQMWKDMRGHIFARQAHFLNDSLFKYDLSLIGVTLLCTQCWHSIVHSTIVQGDVISNLQRQFISLISTFTATIQWDACTVCIEWRSVKAKSPRNDINIVPNQAVVAIHLKLLWSCRHSQSKLMAVTRQGGTFSPYTLTHSHTHTREGETRNQRSPCRCERLRSGGD